MTAVGERTAQVVLGTSVLTATFRYNPAVSAKAFATMACLCPDRVVLGLGTGEALNETTVTGSRWPDFKRPVHPSYFDAGLTRAVTRSDFWPS